MIKMKRIKLCHNCIFAHIYRYYLVCSNIKAFPINMFLYPLYPAKPCNHKIIHIDQMKLS